MSDVKPKSDVCPVCFNEIKQLSRKAKLKHVEGCIENGLNSDIYYCSFCNKNISKYNDVRRKQHLGRCFSSYGDSNLSSPSTDDETIGDIYGSRYSCPLCGLKLNDRSFSVRSKHLKLCSKSVIPISRTRSTKPHIHRSPYLNMTRKVKSLPEHFGVEENNASEPIVKTASSTRRNIVEDTTSKKRKAINDSKRKKKKKKKKKHMRSTTSSKGKNRAPSKKKNKEPHGVDISSQDDWDLLPCYCPNVLTPFQLEDPDICNPVLPDSKLGMKYAKTSINKDERSLWELQVGSPPCTSICSAKEETRVSSSVNKDDIKDTSTILEECRMDELLRLLDSPTKPKSLPCKRSASNNLSPVKQRKFSLVSTPKNAKNIVTDKTSLLLSPQSLTVRKIHEEQGKELEKFLSSPSPSFSKSQKSNSLSLTSPTYSKKCSISFNNSQCSNDLLPSLLQLSPPTPYVLSDSTQPNAILETYYAERCNLYKEFEEQNRMLLEDYRYKVSLLKEKRDESLKSV